jgi:hypothetical protein
LDQRDGGFEKWMVRVGPTDRSAQCVAAVAKSQDLLLYNHEIDFQKGRQTVKRGHHEIAGVLWKGSVALTGDIVYLRASSDAK